ncbi:MAG: sugar phosphate nucleotidyltransferase [Candidatus Methanomethylicaceae archaeon]|nr:sugar phosphate nucleotidyltransferase [Candidatus Verstraetearchaeota archaeon]
MDGGLNTKAVILAAGKGVRLEPFTITRPKHLIPIAGAPLIEHIINSLKKINVEEVIIIVKYMADLIKTHLGDGSRFGIKIKYVEQSSLGGTGEALLSCKELLKNNNPFIVVYGDLAFHSSIMNEIVSSFEESYFGVILGIHKKNSKEFGVLLTKNNFLLKIEEKSKIEDQNLINGGIYILKPEIFDFLIKTSKSSRGEIELTDAINLVVNNGGKILIVKAEEDKWVDVGRPWDVLEANKILMDEIIKEKKILGEIEEGAHILGNVVIEEGAHILSGSYIEGPVWISSGCKVGPNCYIRPYTYLCKNVRVGNACEIKSSIIMENTHIGHLSYIGDSVIGSNCNFGAGTIISNLRFDESPIKVTIKGEKVSSNKRKLGAFVGDNVKTGINVSIYPGVKIGPNSWICPHTLVYKDVPQNTFVFQKFELEFREK